MKIKKGLGNVRWKSSNKNTSWNISVVFRESCLYIYKRLGNEYLTSVKCKKRDHETQVR